LHTQKLLEERAHPHDDHFKILVVKQSGKRVVLLIDDVGESVLRHKSADNAD
jgi:hypothetical protein